MEGGRKGGRGPGLTAFVPPDCCDGRKEGKKGEDLEEEDEGEEGRSVVGPQQMLIRGVGSGFWTVVDQTNPQIDAALSLFLGYDKLHSSLLQGACLKGLKVTQMTSFSIVSSSYSIFPPTCTHTL